MAALRQLDAAVAGPVTAVELSRVVAMNLGITPGGGCNVRVMLSWSAFQELLGKLARSGALVRFRQRDWHRLTQGEYGVLSGSGAGSAWAYVMPETARRIIVGSHERTVRSWEFDRREAAREWAALQLAERYPDEVERLARVWLDEHPESPPTPPLLPTSAVPARA